jgi:hypothetical protein
MLVHSSPPQMRGGETAAETLLAQAVILTALRDLRSTRAHIRADAEAWAQNPAAVGLWAEVLGVDVDRLMQALQRAVRQG